jgi:hypothetical protein
MTENIAERIREDRRPGGEIFALSAEAKRLRRALAVVEKWIDAAWKGEETGHLTATAETTRDQLEERLARTAFRMEFLKTQSEWPEAREVEDLDEAVHAATLSDALLRVYCILRHVPDEEFGGEVPERERYACMGALLAAQEAADAQLRRLTGGAPS